MSELEDVTTLVRTATPLLVIEAVDEQRVIECFRYEIAQALRPLWRCTSSDGLSRLDFAQLDGEIAPDAIATLEAIHAQGQRGIYLMFDFHGLLRYAMSLRPDARDRAVAAPHCAYHRAGRREDRTARGT